MRYPITTILFIGLLSTHLQAATWTISNTADSGTGSIRSALSQAINGDTLIIPSGTYTVNSSLIIKQSLTLKGSGSSLVALDGAHSQRIMQFEPNSAATLTIDGIQFQNGASNDGLGGAGLLVNNSNATVTIQNSTFYNNSATVKGGAISNNGPLTIHRATFFNNHAPAGAAIDNAAASTLHIHYSTFVQNNALTGSSAAIDNAGSLQAEASLFFNTTDCSGTGAVSSLGYNLESGTSCAFTTGNLTPDYQNQATLPVANTLSTIGTTQILQPLKTATALIDAASSSCTGVDPAGTTVPQNTRCDIGAVELAQQNTTPTNTTNTENQNNHELGEGNENEDDDDNEEGEGGLGLFNPWLWLLCFIRALALPATQEN